MKRKTNSIPTENWKFGCLPPTENKKIVDDQIWRANRYQNQLVAIELGRRGAVRAVLRQHPEIAPAAIACEEAEAVLEAAREAIREKRKGKGRRAKTEEEVAAVKAAIVPLREAQKKLAEARKVVYARMNAVIETRRKIVDLRAIVAACDATVKKAAEQANEEGKTAANAALRKARQELSAARREECASAIREKLVSEDDATVMQSIEEIDDRAHECCLRARKACDLYWGTYLAVEAAVEAACKRPNPPRLHRSDGSGAVVVQIQKGMTVKDLFSGKDTRLRIDPLPPDAHVPHPDVKIHVARVVRNGVLAHDAHEGACPTKNQYYFGVTGQVGDVVDVRLRRHAVDMDRCKTTVHIRVGTEEKGRGPVWASFPVLIHRPLPLDAKIQWARVLRFAVGPRRSLTKKDRFVENWKYVLMITFEAKSLAARPTSRTGTIAINFGWRAFDRGQPLERVRVATWLDDKGRSGHIELPPTIMTKIERAESLRSTRDDNFERMKLRIKQWLDTQAEIPEWLREATRGLAKWRSGGRIVWFTGVLEKNAPGNAFLSELRDWRRQDEHLWTWEANQRENALATRLHFYRKTVKDLLRAYGTVLVQKFDLRKVSRKPREEDAVSTEGVDQRYTKKIVSPSQLRFVVKRAAQVAGIRSVDIEGKTILCHVCGNDEKWDAAPNIMHTCTKCTRTWDQDTNCCANMLKAAQKTPDGERGSNEPEQVPTRA